MKNIVLIMILSLVFTFSCENSEDSFVASIEQDISTVQSRNLDSQLPPLAGLWVFKGKLHRGGDYNCESKFGVTTQVDLTLE
jgi:hypothetical protein